MLQKRFSLGMTCTCMQTQSMVAAGIKARKFRVFSVCFSLGRAANCTRVAVQNRNASEFLNILLATIKLAFRCDYFIAIAAAGVDLDFEITVVIHPNRQSSQEPGGQKYGN